MRHRHLSWRVHAPLPALSLPRLAYATSGSRRSTVGNLDETDQWWKATLAMVSNPDSVGTSPVRSAQMEGRALRTSTCTHDRQSAHEASQSSALHYQFCVFKSFNSSRHIDCVASRWRPELHPTGLVSPMFLRRVEIVAAAPCRRYDPCVIPLCLNPRAVPVAAVV